MDDSFNELSGDWLCAKKGIRELVLMALLGEELTSLEDRLQDGSVCEEQGGVRTSYEG